MENITPQEIIQTVADYFNIPVESALTTSRKKEFVNVRAISMYFIKEKIRGISLYKIGTYFPGKAKTKDHATVIFLINNVKCYMENDKCYKRDIDAIDNILSPEKEEEIKKQAEKDIKDSLLLFENAHLRQENCKLKNEISRLQGVIYALKTNKRKKAKKIEPLKIVAKYMPGYRFIAPFAEVESSSDKPYSGYKCVQS
jgi:competence CoiA-like predicted nuclease